MEEHVESTNPVEPERDPHLEAARDHMRAARVAMRRSFEAWLPKGVVENQRAAKREVLLAVRSVIDSALSRSEDIHQS